MAELMKPAKSTRAKSNKRPQQDQLVQSMLQAGKRSTNMQQPVQDSGNSGPKSTGRKRQKRN